MSSTATRPRPTLTKIDRELKHYRTALHAARQLKDPAAEMKALAKLDEWLDARAAVQRRRPGVAVRG